MWKDLPDKRGNRGGYLPWPGEGKGWWWKTQVSLIGTECPTLLRPPRPVVPRDKPRTVVERVPLPCDCDLSEYPFSCQVEHFDEVTVINTTPDWYEPSPPRFHVAHLGDKRYFVVDLKKIMPPVGELVPGTPLSLESAVKLAKRLNESDHLK